MSVPARSLAARLAFVRARTVAAPVPFVPELSLHQATELNPLWHETSAELEGWDPAPFWAFPWAGGQAVARYLLDRPEIVRGLRIFDFATGSGLVALAAARAGAASTVACDLDPFCDAAVHINAELNGLSIEFRAGDPMDDPLSGFDVVLAGDVFYERDLAERCARWLGRVAASGAHVIVGDPGRLYSPTRGFVERALYDVPTTLEIECAKWRRTSVLEVLPETAMA